MSSANTGEMQPINPEIAEAVPTQEDTMKTIVMYVTLRRDLKWPLGSVVAQGAHAATGVLWEVCHTIFKMNFRIYCLQTRLVVSI